MQGIFQKEQKDCRRQRIEGVERSLSSGSNMAMWMRNTEQLPAKTCILSKGIEEGGGRIGKKTVDVGGGRGWARG